MRRTHDETEMTGATTSGSSIAIGTIGLEDTNDRCGIEIRQRVRGRVGLVRHAGSRCLPLPPPVGAGASTRRGGGRSRVSRAVQVASGAPSLRTPRFAPTCRPTGIGAPIRTPRSPTGWWRRRQGTSVSYPLAVGPSGSGAESTARLPPYEYICTDISELLDVAHPTSVEGGSTDGPTPVYASGEWRRCRPGPEERDQPWRPPPAARTSRRRRPGPVRR